MGRARNRAKLFLHLRRRAYCARNACKFLSGEARVKSEPYAKLLRAGTCIPFLALTLFMALVLGADDHDLAVSLNDFALVAHRLDRRSDFHFMIPPKIFCKKFAALLPCGEMPVCPRSRSGAAGGNARPQFLLRQVMRPLVKSYGLISSFTVSPGMMRM